MSDETQLAELHTHHELHSGIDQETKANDEMYVNDNPADKSDIGNKPNSIKKEININNPKQELIEAQEKLVNDGTKIKELIKLFSKYIFGCMDKDDFEGETFEINPSVKLYVHRAQIRLIHVWIIGLLIVAFGNADKLGLPRILTIIFFVITTIIPISIYSYFYFAKKRNKRSENEHLSIREFMNNAFGIPHPSRKTENEVDNLFDFDRNKWGLIYSIFVLICSINNIFIFGPFYLTPQELDECGDEDLLLSKGNVFAGKCAINQSGLSQIYVLVCAIAITFPLSIYHFMFS